MDKLTLTLPASKFETPTSFLSRLSARNHCDSISSFCYDVGVDLGAVSCGNKEAIEFVSKIAGLPKDSFANTTVIKTTNMRYILGREELDTATLYRGEIRLCPYCVLNDWEASGQLWDVVHKFHWQIPLIERCELHGVKLITLGPKGITPARFDYIEKIRAHKTTIATMCDEGTADPFDIYLSKRIYGEIPEGWGSQLDIPALCRSSEALGTLLNHGNKIEPTQLNKEDRRAALLRGFVVIQSGRDGIRSELATLKSKTPKTKGAQPQPQYGPLQRLLGSANKYREGYNPLRDIIREYIFDNYPVNPGQKVFGVTLTKRKVFSVRSACREVKIRRELVEEMLIERGYGVRRDAGNFELTKVLTVEAVNDLKSEKNRFMSKNEAARLLGTTEAMFKELHKSGFLQPKLGKGRWERKAFDKLHLDRFLSQVFKDVPFFDRPPKGTTRLDVATRCANCSVSEILSLVINGNLKPAGKLGHARELKSLLINTEELLNAFPASVANGFTKTQACKILQLDVKSLNHLIDHQFLETRRMKSTITRVTNNLILPESIERFQKKYCTLGMLRKSDPAFHKIRFKHLDAMKIVPLVTISKFRRLYRLADIPNDLVIQHISDYVSKTHQKDV